MDNRDRDKLSRNDHSTEAGDVNRKTSERQGQRNDSSADFGQSIGRSENPRGDVSGRNSGSEGYGSSSGRSSSGSMESSRSGSMGGSRSRNSSDLEEESVSRSDRSDRSSDDEGRH